MNRTITDYRLQNADWRSCCGRWFVLLLLLIGQGLAVFSTGWEDAGLLAIRVSNYGMFGSENAGVWPRGSSESYIFGAGLWVGGLALGTAGVRLSAAADSLATSFAVDTVVGFDVNCGFLQVGSELIYYRRTTGHSFDSCVRGFAGSRRAAHAAGDSARQILARVSMGYDPSSGFTEFAPGDLPNEPGYADTLDRVLFATNPADTGLWPVRAPGGSAVYVSNKDAYCVTNDLDAGRHASGGVPLGIKVIQKSYAWYYHYYEDFIFFTYYIINTSTTDSLKNLFSGVCCDADIGDATDDLVGSDQTRNLGYAWDSNFMESGWSHVPGYLGFDFLESPLGPNGQLGLTAFKILRNPGSSGPGEPDPANDLEAYLTLAGFNHTTGRYHPLDSLSQATDARFAQCTGPFDLGPGDTGRVVIAVIYGADTNDLRGNSDLAQRLYDSRYITHRAWVLEPHGGEEISGDFTIRWRDSSATGAPLLADIGCSRDRGRTWRDIVTNIPSSGSYVWHTDTFPDGTRYKVRVTVHDTVAVGEAVSESIFTLNNAGNGPPDIEYLSPQNGSVRGNVAVRWSAADPDRDTLRADVSVSPDSVHWTLVDSDLPNTGSYTWDSYRQHNGAYYIQVQVRDRDTFAAAHSGAPVEVINDHPAAARVEHVAGGCNTLSLEALQYDPAAYTGHTYEVTFEPILRHSTLAEPLYHYNLADVTSGTPLLGPIGLDLLANGQLFTLYSPVVDGYALQFNVQEDKSRFRYTGFHAAQNRSGYNGNLIIHGQDSAGVAPPVPGFEWAFRGSDYVVRWLRVMPPDSLTLEVYDSTNHVMIPYGPTRGDCWQFFGSRTGPYYNPAIHKSFALDGGMFWFNRNNEMTVPPDSGDVWVIRSGGYRVPCAGNVYRFATPVGVAEQAGRLGFGLYRIAPNPLRGPAVIEYAIAAKQRVSLIVLDAAGRRVRTLFSGIRPPGRYAQAWDGRSGQDDELSAGVYFLQLESAQDRSVRKVALVR